VLIPTRPPQSMEIPGPLIMNLVSSLRIGMIKHISWLQTLFTVKKKKKRKGAHIHKRIKYFLQISMVYIVCHSQSAVNKHFEVSNVE